MQTSKNEPKKVTVKFIKNEKKIFKTLATKFWKKILKVILTLKAKNKPYLHYDIFIYTAVWMMYVRRLTNILSIF